MLFRLYNDDMRYVFSRTCEQLIFLAVGSRLDFESTRTVPLIMVLLLIHTLSRAISTFLIDTLTVKVKNEEAIVAFILVAGSLSILRIRNSCR